MDMTFNEFKFLSIYPNVTEKDLINLSKLAEQQKNQHANEIKNRTLKQTHDKKIAENFSPKTKHLSAVNESTKNIGEVFEKANSEI